MRENVVDCVGEGEEEVGEHCCVAERGGVDDLFEEGYGVGHVLEEGVAECYEDRSLFGGWSWTVCEEGCRFAVFRVFRVGIEETVEGNLFFRRCYVVVK